MSYFNPVKTIKKYDFTHDFKEVEKVLLAQAGGPVFTAQPVGMKITNDASKWKVISALQKAIRRSNEDEAGRMAEAMYHYDDPYLYRRMGIIALEDIGFGDPETVGFVLALQGKKKWRENNGGVLLAIDTARRMARSVKDRTFCNISSAASLHKDKPLAVEDFVAGYSITEAINTFLDGGQPLWYRHLCGRALTGALKISAEDSPTKKAIWCVAAKDELMDELRDAGIPTLIRYFVHKGGSIGAEGLHPAGVLAWPHLKASSHALHYGLHPLTPEIRIAGVLSSAYDKHVWQGQQAIHLFKRNCEPVRLWLELMGNPDNAWDVVASAVFNAESCLLSPQLHYPWADETTMYEMQINSEHRFNVPGKDFMQLIAIVGENINTLNTLRKEVHDAK